MVQADLEKLRVVELIALLPEELIKEYSLKNNTKKTVVLDVVAKHLDITLVDSKVRNEDLSKALIEERKEENELKAFAKSARVAFARKPGPRTYVAKNHNYFLKPKGIDKKGKLMRYVEGYDTLDIKSQNENNPDGVRLVMIAFKGIPKVERFNIEGFGEVRSMITVPESQPLLQEFLENNKFFGNFFTEWDKKKQGIKDILAREEKGKLEGLIANASKDDLLVPLVYADMKMGIDTFDKLVKLDVYELKQKAYDVIDYDHKEFLENVENSYARALHLVNKAKKSGIIKVTRDNRNVLWVSNNESFVTIPIGSLWNEEVISYMLKAENVSVVQRLQELTGFKVLS